MHKRLFILIPLVVVAVAGALGWRLVAAANGRSADAAIAVSGRIEGDESAVAAKIRGRVVRSREAVATADLDYINSVFAHNVAKLALARATGEGPDSIARFLTVQ